MPRQGIGVQTSIGWRPHRVRLSNPSDPVPDGEGGYIETPGDLNPPEVWAHIEPASAGSLEAVAAGTVVGTATHIVRMPYHAGVTLETSIAFGSRRFAVVSLANLDERNVELVAICSEVVR